MEHCSSPLCDRQTWGPLAFITGCHACQCPVCMCAKLFQLSCLALCDPMDRSPPGSSVHGILQARILEWVGIPFSRGSSQPSDRTCVSSLLHCQTGSLPLSATWEARLTYSRPLINSGYCDLLLFCYGYYINKKDSGAEADKVIQGEEFLKKIDH